MAKTKAVTKAVKKVSLVPEPTTELELAYAEFDKLLQAASNAQLKSLDASPLNFEARKGSDYAFSTESLCLDLLMGGGVPRHRMTVFSGASYVGKTTVMQRVMKSALGKNANAHYIDQEGSADPTWMLRNGLNFERYLATKDIARKLTAVMDLPSGDAAFRYMSRMCDAYSEIISKNPKIAQIMKDHGYAALGLFLDSLPACIPEALVENDEASAMAAQARMFSLMIPLVRTKLKAANATFVTVNQLRTKPGVVYGDPDYEPGGNAPTFYSDIKIRMAAISKAKDVWDDKKDHPLINKENIRAGGIHSEVNEDGSTDEYKYVRLNSVKNRVFPPFLTTYMRIWTGEDGGPGRGIDPVFDTIHFYERLGMLSFDNIRGKGSVINFEGKTYSYQDIKKEILSSNSLHERGLEMMRSGEAYDRFFDARSTRDVEELAPLSLELGQETDEEYKAVEQSVKDLEEKANMSLEGKVAHE